ncbi:MAG TPA: thiazole synthase [Spirochaetota bacterium]|nr:thiazole synthase [Spirochaetota bacterium]HOM38424.1 thiazole synthase [Spirochaetota bacterium]HPQ48963.1 thiazole synthase [Spirochaetota bacterium]
MNNDNFIINNKVFNSRLLIGTGKFSSPNIMRDAIEASGSQIVTVALRRVDLEHPEDNLLNYIDPIKYQLLPNTSGARNSIEAVRLARLGRAVSGTNWIKLEVIPDFKNLLPDPFETFEAAKILVKEGFVVLPYIQADPILAKKLEEIGCATVMPLGSPIGSNKGIKTREMIEIIIEESNVPVIVDAGIGTASDAAIAMELGADGVLVNTAIATSKDPVKMALAMSLAVRAGRLAYLAGRPPYKKAEASSPLLGFLEE